MDINNETHEVFKKTLKKSQLAVVHMGELLTKNRGMEVHIPKLQVAPTFDVRGAYTDGGDLWARETVGPWRRYEVRWFMKGNNFTCRSDFPHAKITAYPATSWNKLIQQQGQIPARVFYFNNDRSAFCVVNVFDVMGNLSEGREPKWKKEVKWNRRYEQPQDNYMLPWEDIESWWTVDPWQKTWPLI